MKEWAKYCSLPLDTLLDEFYPDATTFYESIFEQLLNLESLPIHKVRDFLTYCCAVFKHPFPLRFMPESYIMRKCCYTLLLHDFNDILGFEKTLHTLPTKFQVHLVLLRAFIAQVWARMGYCVKLDELLHKFFHLHHKDIISPFVPSVMFNIHKDGLFHIDFYVLDNCWEWPNGFAWCMSYIINKEKLLNNIIGFHDINSDGHSFFHHFIRQNSTQLVINTLNKAIIAGNTSFFILQASVLTSIHAS